ncbi:MAG: Mur ligase family protein, partial [Planctomycetota bacterium]
MEKEFFKNKKVVIMGLGRFGGGVDSALFAAKCGADVLVTDLAAEADLAAPLQTLKDFPIRTCFGRHDEADFTGADVVIVNPAVPPDNKLVQTAARAGALVTSQMELFFQLCPACVIGITGANGKSTTTSLAAHILQAGANQGSYGNVFLAGNIGNKPLLDIVDQIAEDDLVVLEISNFQLEQLDRIAAAPHIALITNLTPNHLDRHGTFKVYCRVKENIFIHQKPNPDRPLVSIFNAEDPITSNWYNKYLKEDGRRCL